MTVSGEAVGLISLAVTMCIQSCGVIWWASRLTARVEHIERWIASNQDVGHELFALKSTVQSIQHSLTRIENYLIKHHSEHGEHHGQ